MVNEDYSIELNDTIFWICQQREKNAARLLQKSIRETRILIVRASFRFPGLAHSSSRSITRRTLNKYSVLLLRLSYTPFGSSYVYRVCQNYTYLVAIVGAQIATLPLRLRSTSASDRGTLGIAMHTKSRYTAPSCSINDHPCSRTARFWSCVSRDRKRDERELDDTM